MRTPFPRLRPRVRPTVANDDGFTLIEVLVSMFLLVVGVFGALAVLTQADQTQTVAQRTDVAALAAQQQIDALRSRDYRALAVKDPSTATLGSVGGHPNLGNLPTNASLSASTKGQLQDFYARDTTLSPRPGYTAPAVKIGRSSGDAAATTLVEELVDPADPLQGSRGPGGAVVEKAVPAYRVMDVALGGGQSQRVHTFTRVSWRDVSCPILDLDNPLGQVKELLANLGSLLRPSANGTGNSLYDLLLGSQGAIAKLLTGRDALVTNLLASLAPSQPTTVVGALLTALLGDNSVLASTFSALGAVLQQATSALFTPISDLAAPVGTLLSAIVSPLANRLDPLLNLVTSLSGKLTDLCDVSLADDGSGKGLLAPLQSLLPGLTKANDALAGLQRSLLEKNLLGNLIDATSNVLSGSQVSTTLPSCPILAIVDPCQTTAAVIQLVQTVTRGLTSVVTETIGPILETLTSTVTGLPQTLQAVAATIGDLPAKLAALATNADGSILNTNKNTKRITVAVWPEDQGRLVGSRPQYFTTVVANPKASLLSADEAG
jgi:prepilin-type N-terminal cleavage/methylation domain-containing protein